MSVGVTTDQKQTKQSIYDLNNYYLIKLFLNRVEFVQSNKLILELKENSVVIR